MKNTGQTKLMGIVESKWVTGGETYEEMPGMALDGGWFPKQTPTHFFILVNGVSLEIPRNIAEKISEGDEVSITYSQNRKKAKEVDIIKKVTPEKTEQIVKEKQKDAIRKYQERYERKIRRVKQKHTIEYTIMPIQV